MKLRPSFVLLLLALTASAASLPQASAPPVTASVRPPQPIDLAAARALLAQLHGTPADAAIFNAWRNRHPAKLLLALTQPDQAMTAGASQWQELHRVYRALIELMRERGDYQDAAKYATLQSTFYQLHEGDGQKALAAEREALHWAQLAPPPHHLTAYHMGLAHDLLLTHQPAAAIPELQGILANPKLPLQVRWMERGDLLQARLDLRQYAAAGTEVRGYLRAASDASGKGRALLLQSRLELAQEQYESAERTLRQAWTGASPAARKSFLQWEVAGQLLQCVLASEQTLPYGAALKLAREISRDFPSMPLPLGSFAQAAIRLRERMAGNYATLLREDARQLAQARRSGNIDAQIDALMTQSADERALGNAQRDVDLLKQIRQLQLSRPLPTGNGARIGQLTLRATVLNLLGDAYLRLRAPERAREAFNKVTREVAQAPGAFAGQQLASYVVESRMGKANADVIDDDPEDARDELRALLARLQTHPVGATSIAEIYLALARAESASGDSATQVSSDYEVAISRAGREKDSTLVVESRLAYARYLLLAGGQKLPQARNSCAAQLSAAAREARALRNATLLWQVQYLRGRLAEAAGQSAGAIRGYQAAEATLEGIRSHLAAGDLRRSLQSEQRAQRLYRHLTGLLARSQPRGAWRVWERNQARAFVEQLEGGRLGHFGETPAAQAIERRIAGLQVELGQPALLRLSGADAGQLQSQLHTLQDKLRQERQLAQLRDPRLALAHLSSPRLAAVQRALPSHGLLLEYAMLPRGVAVFEIRRNGFRLRSWKADPKRLRSRILRLHEKLASAGVAPQEQQAALRELSQALLWPLVGDLPPRAPDGRGRPILIVPAGVMNYVPFAALPDAQGEPLLERGPVNELPSAAVVAVLHHDASRRRTDGELFIGALGQVRVGGYPALPGTLREAAGIHQLFPRAQEAEGSHFTYARLRQALLTDAAVHFATHGKLDEQAPLFSALITAPAAGQPDRFSLYELLDMRVRSRLVVLSACQTGLGRVQPGSEVSSLTRAFLAAGADTVVSSLWEVSDESTSYLMRHFYAGLRDGRGPGQALRAAELATRRRYPQPFFWAPFIVTGTGQREAQHWLANLQPGPAGASHLNLEASGASPMRGLAPADADSGRSSRMVGGLY